VNPGSEPERDDTGLPPIDVEIPDDARELDRDVQAYHREQRAQRRRSRRFRVHGLLARDGMALPLLACCLIFALITGTLLTVFTASGIDHGMPGAPGSGRLGGSAPFGSPGAGDGLIPPVQQVAAMPPATISEGGHAVPLERLQSTALLLVPPDCNCADTLDEVAVAMKDGGVTTLLVLPVGGAPGSELAQAEAAGAIPATDPSGALSRTYQQMGLTALLVTANRTVLYTSDLVPSENMSALLPKMGA
jgi:hypothetical protein